MPQSREERLAQKREYAKRKRLSDPEGERAKQRAKYAADPEKYKRSVEIYRRTVLGQPPRAPKQSREIYLAKKRERARRESYGITDEQFESMITVQQGRCKICGDEFGKRRATHVDHDHRTGLVRGILCHHCNVGLGCFRDDTERLLRAVNYLAPR